MVLNGSSSVFGLILLRLISGEGKEAVQPQLQVVVNQDLLVNIHDQMTLCKRIIKMEIIIIIIIIIIIVVDHVISLSCDQSCDACFFHYTNA